MAAAAVADGVTSVGAVLASSLFAAVVLSVLIQLLLRGRRTGLPPGPAGLPVVGSLPFLDPELHVYFARLAAKHGIIFSLRLGAKLCIVVSSPALAREVLRDQDATFANRDVPRAARVLAYGGSAEIVWNPLGPTWRMLRKVTVHELLGHSSVDWAGALRRREMRALVRRFKEHADAGAAVDVGAEMFAAMMDMMTSMSWGGHVEAGDRRRSATGKEFQEVVAKMTDLLGRPNVSDFFPALVPLDLQGIEKEMNALMLRFDAIFDEIIARREAASEPESGREDGNDFLQLLLKKVKEAGSDGDVPMTMTNVKALLMDMVVGGTETSSNTTEWALAEMLARPDTLHRAQLELDAVVSRDRSVEESDLPHLPYLSLVVKETLRLHPPLPLLVPHCPSAAATIGGYLIPAGSRVFVNVRAIQRDPALWPDPETFIPDRFASNVASSSNDLSYFPFGSGRRACAGIVMAERSVLFSLALLLHSFNWRLPDDARHDFSEKFGIVLKKAKPLVAVPSLRLPKAELYR